MNNFPRWLGWLWFGGALIAILGSLGGVVFGWVLVGRADSALVETTMVTRRILVTVADTTDVIDGVFDDVADSLLGVQSTLSDTSLTLTRASAVTSNLSEVVSSDVPAAVEAVREALPALIDTGRVIDRTMRGLSLLGVDYDPEVPLDASLTEIDERLAEIPVLLGAQQDTLDGVAADLGGFGSSTVEIAEDLAAIRVRLSEASTVLAEYGSIIDDSQRVLDDLERNTQRNVAGLRLVIVLVGLGFAATQSVPLLVGWRVARLDRSPLP